jgi:SRSO17 transposase
MNTRTLNGVQRRLDAFLQELIEPMNHTTRQAWALTYIQGLLLDGARKSVQPIAQRLRVDEQGLSQFLNQSPWEVEEVQRRLAQRTVPSGTEPTYWLLDETSFPKQGFSSVGVAHQYCGALGKQARCQVGVSLHWCQGETSWPVSWRLFLPEEWISDPVRCRQAGIPASTRPRTKAQLGLDLIEQALAWNLSPGCTLADSAYGNIYDFRQQLRTWQVPYAVAARDWTIVWLQDPVLPPLPPVRKKRHRVVRPPHFSLTQVAEQLPRAAWKRQRLAGRTCWVALVPVWAAHQPTVPCSRDREWLLLERPSLSEPMSDGWFLWKPLGDYDLKTAHRDARARFRVEQDYRELKEELGLDHFEGRSWRGWHHHVTLVSLAFCFLKQEQARFKKKRRGSVVFTVHPQPPSTPLAPSSRLVPVVPHKAGHLLT